MLNNQNAKILYIFRKDGSLLISTDGSVVKAHWEYVKENQTILIEDSEHCCLFHPVFYDDIVLAIQQDGTEKCLAMVNFDKASEFLELTVEAINKHFLYTAHPEIREAEKREAREKREREELERKRILEERRPEIERDHADEIQEVISPYIQERKNSIKTSIIISLIICIFSIYCGIIYDTAGLTVIIPMTTAAFSYIITTTILEGIDNDMQTAKEKVISKYL